MVKNTVIVVVGPTAVGKTKLGIEIAKKIQGEVISGDSMQIYQGMDIGTAKVGQKEMENVPHHMIDIKSPEESFSVADFQEAVQSHIKSIHDRHKYPIIVGGSGLYIQATLYNYNFSNQTRDPQFTRKLENEIESLGIMPFYKKLEEIDSKAAKTIHPNNHRRIIRALEVFETTGKTVTDQQDQQQTDSSYKVHLIGLEMERKTLYNRINERVDQMLNSGLEAEVKHLYNLGLEEHQAMKAIGYKEFVPYFKGQQSLEEVIQILKRNSRRYAKRQYTWFKNKMNVKWYNVIPGLESHTFESILQDLAGILENE